MKVTFENATIQDAIGKAASVAAKRGEAFDKASGILVTSDPEEGTIIIRSTNLQIFYLEVVDTIEVDEDFEWRFPSGLLNMVMGKLPIGSGKQVTFEQKGGEVHMSSGRTKAKFNILDPAYFPKWEPFNPDLLEMVPNFGSAIQQVEWAALDDHEISYAGIHLDGKQIVATDRIRLATTPCEAEPIYKPITIPSGILRPVIANLKDVAIGINEGQFLLMPDVSTQIRTRIYDREYPDVLRMINDRTWNDAVEVKKSDLVEIIDRAMVFAHQDRSPKLTFIIGKGEIAVLCSNSETGLLGDAMDIPGQCDHKRSYMYFTPKNLIDALSAAPDDTIVFKYDTENTVLPILIESKAGYRAVVMPRREIELGNV